MFAFAAHSHSARVESDIRSDCTLVETDTGAESDIGSDYTMVETDIGTLAESDAESEAEGDCQSETTSLASGDWMNCTRVTKVLSGID